MLHNLWPTAAPSGDCSDRACAARLTDVRTITFSGPDALTFMQGYLTIDPTRLTDDGTFRLAAMTNLQGRVVASGWCARVDAERLDWVVHESLASRVLEFLKPYLAFAKSSARQVPEEDDLVIGLPGADPPTVTRLEDSASLEDFLASHLVVAESCWRNACVEAGLVLVSEPLSEEFLPQMLGLVALGAVAFDKGCYLGQEVVARAQHRGRVKRELVRLQTDAAAPAVGTALLDADASASGVVAVIGAERPDAPLALLAVVRSPPAASYYSDGEEFRLSAGANSH